MRHLLHLLRALLETEKEDRFRRPTASNVPQRRLNPTPRSEGASTDGESFRLEDMGLWMETLVAVGSGVFACVLPVDFYVM
jgi:hypothetical protein